MKNPWEEIKGPNYYTANDGEIIRKFNASLEKKDKDGKIIKEKEDSLFHIDLRLMPEPYIGNKNANVILLFTNPGLKKTELHEYKAFPAFEKSLKNNLTHSNTDYPYYYFNPAFKMNVDGKEKYIAGAEWIRKRTKEMRKALGENHLQILANGIFTFQLHPYHSKRYNKNLPELEVAKYTEYLFKKVVEKARKGKTLIICIRSYGQWDTLYKKIFNTTNDFEKDLRNNFILLKDKNGNALRTPFFSENLLGKNNFDRVVKLLKKQPLPASS